MFKILVTCPPMLGQLQRFEKSAHQVGLDLVAAETTQVLTEDQLIALVPKFDGWIIGDDPASKRVFEAGAAGKLKAAVKWGIGVDNVDFEACKSLNIPITNTPNMFGGEVADVAVALMIGLARHIHLIDRGVRDGDWPKPAGVSISGKHVGVVGFGDIGRSFIQRLAGFDVTATVYDPGNGGNSGFDYVKRAVYPDGLGECDFLVFTCALNKHNVHMLNAETLALMKPGARVINVARGPLIDEEALAASLRTGHIAGAALDVYELEPLPLTSPLREIPQCVFGSHNGSNTVEGVERATHKALDAMAGFLNGR